MSNMDADPSNSSRRVQRTLHEVNQLLGAAFVYLSSDSPFWWREFSAAVARIDYMSPTWSMALHELAVTPVRPVVGPRSSTPANRAPAAHPSARSVSRQPATRNRRPGSIPAHIREIIPRNEEGDEPCLRFFDGSMCDGGSRDQCAFETRTHTWSGDLPPALMKFIKERFGSRGRGQNHRRRA